MTAPLLALKVDVDTLRGTLEGVPRLMDLFRRRQTDATFLFSLGPDHTGWAIRRVFRQGFLGKVKRTSVLEHYGLKTLLYGTLLPGPDIGRRAGEVMRSVRDAGFETGIHCWDHVLWQDHAAHADWQWTLGEMRKAVERYTEIFGVAAAVHGAAGWQMNRYALRLTGELGFAWCSDSRGTHPFLPVVDGKTIACPQLP
ncbi:MAG: 4-deoxy-4-formamido-L-arabinose-phosphoundecaprenol deformylase, partial [Candidatus Competibacteraceae bacterium]|nr:4-deoxy-4-formamido-L-arabinose-phosphoundecaprenol deformylase [Candidatus Competibacteraceae bacterium]